MIKILILVHFTVTIDMQKYQIYLKCKSWIWFKCHYIPTSREELRVVRKWVCCDNPLVYGAAQHGGLGAAVSMQFIRHNWRSSSKIRKLDLSLNYNVCLAKLVETQNKTVACVVYWALPRLLAVVLCGPLLSSGWGAAEVRLLNQSVTFPDLTWAAWPCWPGEGRSVYIVLAPQFSNEKTFQLLQHQCTCLVLCCQCVYWY